MTKRKGTLLRKKYGEYLLATLAMSASLFLAAIVDNIMVGNFLGADALAALNLTFPIVYIKNIVFCIFIYGGNTLAAIYKGKRDNNSANKSFTFSVLFGVVASTLMVILGIAFARPTAMALSQGGPLFDLTLEYTIPLWVSGPLVLFNSGIATYVRNDGMKKLAIALPVVSNAINLALDYVYMALFGWGVAGAGWATVSGYAIGSLLLVFYFTSKHRTVKFVRVGIHDIKLFLSVLKTGLPMALSQACNVVRTCFINAIILSAAGTVGMQIISICMSAFNIAMIFISGSSTTLMPICGALYGERDNKGVHYVLRFSLIITEIMCIAVLVVYELFPLYVGRLFAPVPPETAVQLELAIRIFSLCIPFYGISYNINAFYQCTKQSFAASLFTVLEGVVFIVPMIYLFALISTEMMWLSFTLAEIAALSVTVVAMQIIARKKQRTSFLMLDSSAEQGVLDMTIENRQDSAVEASKAVEKFCIENEIDSGVANILAVTAEELAVNAAKYAYKGKNDIDICLRILEDDVVLSFRDNGVNFNPTEYMDDSGEIITGLSLVRSITPDISYNRVLGFNVTVVKIKKSNNVSSTI